MAKAKRGGKLNYTKPPNRGILPPTSNLTNSQLESQSLGRVEGEHNRSWSNGSTNSDRESGNASSTNPAESCGETTPITTDQQRSSKIRAQEEWGFFKLLEKSKGQTIDNWQALYYEFWNALTRHPLGSGSGNKYQFRLALNSYSSTNWLAPPDPEIEEWKKKEALRKEQESDSSDDDFDEDPPNNTDRIHFILWRKVNDDTCRVGDLVGQQLGYVEYVDISATGKARRQWKATNIPVAFRAIPQLEEKEGVRRHIYVSIGKTGLCLINPNAFLLPRGRAKETADVPEDVLADLGLEDKVWVSAPRFGATAESGPALLPPDERYTVYHAIVTSLGVKRLDDVGDE